MGSVTFKRSLFAVVLLLSVALSLPYISLEAKPYTITDKQVQSMYEKLWIMSGERDKQVPLTIADDDVVNAFATYDGITVYKGLIKTIKSDDELALVLGHEISHVLLGHVDPVTENNDKSKERVMFDEVKADKYGAFLSMRAGYNICKGRELMLRWTYEWGNVLNSTHPVHIYRYNELNVNCGKV